MFCFSKISFGPLQLSDVGRALKKSTAQKVVIDHHVSADDLGGIEFKDTEAEATGALIYRLAQALGRGAPPLAQALRVRWSLHSDPYLIPITQVASPPYEYGFSIDIQPLTPPNPDGTY